MISDNFIFLSHVVPILDTMTSFLFNKLNRLKSIGINQFYRSIFAVWISLVWISDYIPIKLEVPDFTTFPVNILSS